MIHTLFQYNRELSCPWSQLYTEKTKVLPQREISDDEDDSEEDQVEEEEGKDLSDVEREKKWRNVSWTKIRRDSKNYSG